MQETKQINVVLDIALSVPAKSNAEAHEKLNKMDIFKQLKRAVEQCDFGEFDC